MKRTIVMLACTLVGCFEVTTERTRFDRTVGHVAQDELTLDVDDGLAVVRDIGPGFAVLWSSAPAIRVTLTHSTTVTDWTIRVNNAMPGALLLKESTALSVTRHETPLPTQHIFQVRVPPGTTSFRIAPVDFDTQEPWRFSVLSDVQEAIGEVQDIYGRMNEDNRIRFMLGAGDLTDQGSTEELERFQTELEQLRVPYYTTLGNHELGSGPPPFQRMFGRANSSFEFKGVRFTMLDSASASLDTEVYTLLDDWLLRGNDAVHIVSMHIPPLDPIGARNGAFASRNEAAKLLNRLAAGHVDLTIYGHIHSFYEFENAGIPARISGGGGAIPERFDGFGRHYLTVDVSPDQGVGDIGVVRID